LHGENRIPNLILHKFDQLIFGRKRKKPTDIANPLITLSDFGKKYLEEGTVILQNEKGEVEQISNVKNVVK
jgi:hypothetical protein